MPRAKIAENFEVDTDFFTRAIEDYARSHLLLNVNIMDYIKSYGSKKELATSYAERNGLKYDTARKQIERMLKKPDMKLKPDTISRLGKLSDESDSVAITIQGYYSYNGGGWEYEEFNNYRRPFSASEMKDIIRTTRFEGQQAGIDKFMRLYGVDDGLSPQFASTPDLYVSIDDMG